MAKQLIKNYSYNTTSKTVTLTDFTTVSLDRLQLITDVTTNTIIYNFADSSVATATVAGNVITLSAAPGSNTDKLMVIYDAASGDPTYDGYRELAGLTAGALNADLVPSTDVSGYRWYSMQVTGTFVGTLTLQGSNDGTNFSSVIGYRVTSTPQTGFTTISAADMLTGPLQFRYFRVRMTAYTSGSAVGTLELWTTPTQSITQSVLATQTGTWSVGSNSATGSAVPANAFYMGAINAAGNLTGIRMADIGDGISNIFTAGMQPYIYNGTNADRAKSATSAAGTTGTGVPAAGMLGFDGTNYQRVATDTSGLVKVLGSSATGAAVPTNAVFIGAQNTGGNLTALRTSDIGDTQSGITALVAAPYNFNGSNIDRQRGNWNGLLGDTGAKTASFNGLTQTNYNASGANIVLEVGTVSGTSPTLTAQVQGSADGGTTWFNVTGAVTPSITATGVYVLTVYPGTTPVANAAVATPLPRTWRLSYTIGGTTPSFTLTSVRAAYNN